MSLADDNTKEITQYGNKAQLDSAIAHAELFDNTWQKSKTVDTLCVGDRIYIHQTQYVRDCVSFLYMCELF